MFVFADLVSLEVDRAAVATAAWSATATTGASSKRYQSAHWK
jgi:hypothetical protein